MIDFFFAPTLFWVLSGCILLSIQSAAIGCFTVLNKQSLAGDAVAHAVLPGICIAFLLTGEKDGLLLLISASISGWIALQTIQYISQTTKIKTDASIGIILSVFFGIGILLLTSIQQSGNGNQSGLDKYILGKAAGMLPEDILLLLCTCSIILLVLALFRKEIIAYIFDIDFAKSSGIPFRLIRFCLLLLLIINVVSGIQTVGVVLMAALIITPVSAARFWSDSIQKVYTISLIIGIISAFVGVGFSFYIANAPTGATIVLALTSVFFISAFFAPHKGIIARLYKQFNHKEKTQQENILKLCFHSIEHNDSLKLPLLTHSEIQNFEVIMNDQGILHWKKHSKSLIKKGFLSYSAISDTWYITKEGLARGQRITRLHRLWEAYLLHHLQFDIDHVHEDADSIEHILTPELELALETILNNPKFDPHGETIPRIYIY